MKLKYVIPTTTLLESVVVDGIEVIVTETILSETISKISVGHNKGGLQRTANKDKSSLAAIVNNPALAGMAAGLAVAAVQNYYKNKRYTTRFFAKGHRDVKFYQSIVDDLMKSGNYRTVRIKRVDGGKLWELQRVKD